MFITIITHAATFWRLAKTFRSYYFKFRPPLVELVADTKATDIDDKALAVLDKIFFYKANGWVTCARSRRQVQPLVRLLADRV